MPSSGLPSLDTILEGGGYPEKSAILIIGPPGIGKEALCYLHAKAGVNEGAICLYMTTLSMREIIEDERSFGIDATKQSAVWIAREGGQEKTDPKDLTHLKKQVETFLIQNRDRKIRIVADILSPILMLNSADTAYSFVDSLLTEAKQHDAVLVATLEEGMQPVQAQVAMQRLFDGVIELTFHKTGLRVLSLVRIVKMRGTIPHQDYYTVSFTSSGIHLQPASISSKEREIIGPRPSSGHVVVDPGSVTRLGKEARVVFDYLVKSFN